jgi:murein DD-endopeptidase MepM/ murein hydrolase activator NlpD
VKAALPVVLVLGLILAMVPRAVVAGTCPASTASGACQNPTPGPTPTPTTDPATQHLIDQTRQQLGSSIADALSVVQTLTDAMNRNTSEQDQIQQRIDATQAQLDQIDQDIQNADDQIQSTQQQIDNERQAIGALARVLYQQPDSLLLRLLRAGNVRDMVTQTSDLASAALHADSLKKQLSDNLTKLNDEQAKRNQDRQQQAQLSDQLTAAQSQLQDLATSEQDTLDSLQAAIDDGNTAMQTENPDLNLVQQALAMLQQRKQALIATAEQQVWQQEQLWAALNQTAIPPPPATTTANPTGSRFIYPIHGATLTQGFGPSTLWLEPAMFGFAHFHTGLDFASTNTRIDAAADGVVAAASPGTTGYGNYVIIVHRDGFVTLYGHLSAILVKVGDRVTQGQQIGVEGTTGASTGVHLHFEVRLNGVPIDPSPYLPALGSA